MSSKVQHEAAEFFFQRQRSPVKWRYFWSINSDDAHLLLTLKTFLPRGENSVKHHVYHPEAYSKPCEIYMMELFCENSQHLKAVKGTLMQIWKYIYMFVFK